MERYFGNFELIRYNDKTMVNIMDRTAILNSVFGNSYAFYPYHVKDGMRAEMVAERYYGDPNLVWLVYFSNNIVDPYHDWPMDQFTFNKFISDKYGSVQAASQTMVDYRINWFEDTRTLTPTQYFGLQPYEKKYWTPQFDINNVASAWVRKELDISATAKDSNGNVTLSVPAEEQSYWIGVTALDYEEEQNAIKTNIRLLDSRLAPVAVQNIEKLLAV